MKIKLLKILSLSLVIHYSTMISSAQEPINTKYGIEYISTINNNKYRCITDEHIRDIELKEAKLESDEKIITVLQDQVTQLQRALDAAKRVEAIDAKMDSILHSMLDNRNQAISF